MEATEARLTVESSSPFLFAACCAYLDRLAPSQPATVVALRPREPDFSLFFLARSHGVVTFRETPVHYRLETCSLASATDGKPEPFKQVHLATSGERAVLEELVRVAVEQHRARMSAPRGGAGGGVMRYVWDDDAECWDAGKMVHCRMLDTLFMPEGVAEGVVQDLSSYLSPCTQDKYAALHVAPVRVYMLHGIAGGGKTSMVHCLASEMGHNMAILNFRHHTTDHDIATALRNLPPRCFLCIEDIDCLFDKRDNKNHGVSFASLLAALDGAYTGAALTVFMTTNALQHLDPALRRRVDYAIKFGFATKFQCRRMFRAFYPDNPGFDVLWASVSRYKFSTSVMHKFLVRSLSFKDPLMCLDAFDSMIQCAYGTGDTAMDDMYAACQTMYA